ncbi:FMRFamide receptor-like [Gigantopelta aegis]|uniref:FMRFamide receptor-like n=1 Tax=Gigantopelta aegis TaxID=1735272 RepID=UPI001B88C2CC|nr:FMRFamide receptor-like [Gigantopelta aegis]
MSQTNGTVTINDVTRKALFVVESVTLVDNEAAMNATTAHDVLPSNAETLELTRFVIQKVMVPIVVCLGVVGNVTNMAILTRRCMKSSMNSYMTALAAVDILYLVFSLTLSFVHYQSFSENQVYMHWFLYGRVFTDMSANVSVLLTVTFTVERYIGVCLPLKGRILCTVKRAKVVIAIVTAAAITCTVPEMFEMTIAEKTTDISPFLVAEYTEFAMTYGYKMGYYWFFVSVFTFIPLILLCIFNGFLIQSVFKAVQIRRQMTVTLLSKNSSCCNPYSGEQQKITKILITVVLVFLLCQIPGAVLLLYSSYIELADVKLSPERRNDLKIAGNCTNLLVQINASVNFLLYSVLNTKFRKLFCHMLCKTAIPRRVSEYTAVYVPGFENLLSIKLQRRHFDVHNSV